VSAFIFQLRHLLSSGWGYQLNFEVLVLQLLLEYLIFKGLPLFLGEDTAIALISYFHLRIRDPDHRAL
jgi:hypothetical protein